MKKIIGIFGILLACSSAMAGPGSTPADDMFNRIMSDEVLQATVHSIEHKYGAQCVLPANAKAKSISWRCLNGMKCGYSIQIRCACVSKSSTGKDLIIEGFDNEETSTNDISSITIHDMT